MILDYTESGVVKIDMTKYIGKKCLHDLPKEIPIRDADRTPSLRLVGKPVRASANEVDQNPRARSAILRVAERVIVDREVA